MVLSVESLSIHIKNYISCNLPITTTYWSKTYEKYLCCDLLKVIYFTVNIMVTLIFSENIAFILLF